jgi:hypothetical protein
MFNSEADNYHNHYIDTHLFCRHGVSEADHEELRGLRAWNEGRAATKVSEAAVTVTTLEL